jgi:hypothetical protein
LGIDICLFLEAKTLEGLIDRQHRHLQITRADRTEPFDTSDDPSHPPNTGTNAGGK